nr:hypothetical protein [uncultured Noviherbaspirillum sp.]
MMLATAAAYCLMAQVQIACLVIDRSIACLLLRFATGRKSVNAGCHGSVRMGSLVQRGNCFSAALAVEAQASEESVRCV